MKLVAASVMIASVMANFHTIQDLSVLEANAITCQMKANPGEKATFNQMCINNNGGLGCVVSNKPWEGSKYNGCQFCEFGQYESIPCIDDYSTIAAILPTVDPIIPSLFDENKLACSLKAKEGEQITFDPTCLINGGLGCISEDGEYSGCRYCEFDQFGHIDCDQPWDPLVDYTAITPALNQWRTSGLTPLQQLRLKTRLPVVSSIAGAIGSDGLTIAQRAALLSSMSPAQRIKFRTRFPSLYDLSSSQLSTNAFLSKAQRAALIDSMSEGYKRQFQTHFPVWAGLKLARAQQQQQQRAALVDQLTPRSIAARAAFQDAIVQNLVN